VLHYFAVFVSRELLAELEQTIWKWCTKSRFWCHN